LQRRAKIVFIFLFFVLSVSTVCSTQKVTLLINKDYLWVLSKYIRNAKKEILISSFMWCCNPIKYGSYPCKLIDEIVDAVKRGVKVTIVFEKDYRGDYSCNKVTSLIFKDKLDKRYKNFSMYYDSPLIRSHQKVILIDGRYCFIGSHNLTQSALKYNNEVSVLIDSPEIYFKLKKFFFKIEEHGEKIN